jgi:hypothetical protein
MAVIFGEHFAQFLREFIGLAGEIGVVVFASLVVANAESRAAAIAQLERFDRIRRIFLDFLVENRHRTVQIVCHLIILRWFEDCLGQLVVSFESGSTLLLKRSS